MRGSLRDFPGWPAEPYMVWGFVVGAEVVRRVQAALLSHCFDEESQLKVHVHQAAECVILALF